MKYQYLPPEVLIKILVYEYICKHRVYVWCVFKYLSIQCIVRSMYGNKVLKTFYSKSHSMGGLRPRGRRPPIDSGLHRKTKMYQTILFSLNIFKSREEIQKPINI
jgi:hypothetical protein